MTFFNKKEDVFHIELTPYGRYLMSIGKLKPHHYKFFDDDIAYDPYSGTTATEEKNIEAHERIVNETPKLKPNANVTGVETSISILKNNGLTDETQSRFDPLDDNINYLQREIGTSKNNNKSITTKVELFRGELTSSDEFPMSKFLNSKNTKNLNIPQINVEVAYQFKIDSAENVSGKTYNDGTYFSSPYSDGNLYVITPSDPIIRLKQENALDHRENYEITAFIIESGSGGQFYKPLNFIHRPKRIQNGMLIDEVEADDDFVPTPDYVEYYFDINVDSQIPEADLCATVGELPIRNIYLDEKINCPDVSTSTKFNVYSTRVGFEDVEDCD